MANAPDPWQQFSDGARAGWDSVFDRSASGEPRAIQITVVGVLLAVGLGILFGYYVLNPNPGPTPFVSAATRAADEKAILHIEALSAESVAEEERALHERASASVAQPSSSTNADVSDPATPFRSNCGVCHTLAAAGTSAHVGPNLNELKPSDALVEHQVTNGGGVMPALGNKHILTAARIEALAT